MASPIGAGGPSLAINGSSSAAIIAAETPARLLGMRLRILPHDVHGASVGPSGGCFISVQHWLGGVAPTSVHLDWDGPPLDEGHRLTLGL